MSEATVAGYLKQRLEELGLERPFVVAGNYTAPFLDTILEDPRSPIVITGIPNEICAGYAADGYARLRGIGAVAVTGQAPKALRTAKENACDPVPRKRGGVF